MKKRLENPRQKGMVLVFYALTFVVILGMMGLAFDLGRLYLIQNEAQSFADSAALVAAASLHGNLADFGAAKLAAGGTYLSYTNQWKYHTFQTAPFVENTSFWVRFAQSNAGPWEANPSDPTGFRFAEVIARVGSIPMYISPVITGTTSGTISARAVAGQVIKATWDEGLIPFAPLAHCSAENTGAFPPCPPSGDLRTPPSPPADKYGLIPADSPVKPGNLVENWTFYYDFNGTGLAGPPPSSPPGPPHPYLFSIYTLRWRANSYTQSFKKFIQGTEFDVDRSGWCPGDMYLSDWGKQLASVVDNTWDGGRGYFKTADVSNAADYTYLVNGSMQKKIMIGSTIELVNPEVSALKDDLNWRAGLPYPSNIVYAPIADPGGSGTVMGFGSFQLIPNQYGANNSWCALYLGPRMYGVGTDPVNQDGIYELRLVP